MKLFLIAMCFVYGLQALVGALWLIEDDYPRTTTMKSWEDVLGLIAGILVLFWIAMIFFEANQ